ncbi:hypothetical protein BU065_01190 [Staphylococcus succinus]|uniref:hypothetical protein n=1 Tax=Staphylococcus succinus TaxID=61015 RepID=UPI000E69B075|nr:hypothetical protein [Staphylococcus succinus]RIN37020.1 hypothetical protein BU065_01190 [Staphylococcus succinus]
MAYETIDRLKTYMKKKIDAIVTGEKVTFNINAHQLLDEINEMESKAKAFDNYIAEVRERVRFTENTEDDIDREIQKIINHYMGDIQND